jgi:hypothetical protein
VKPLCRVLISFAAFLCFLSCALGQTTATFKGTGSGNTVLNSQPSNLLAFALTSGDDFFKSDKNNNNNNNNNNQGNQCDSREYGLNNKCAKAVPEGGTPLMYLLLAGLACLGGMGLRSRREVSVRQN